MSFERIKEMIAWADDRRHQHDNELHELERRTYMAKEVLPHLGATEEPNIAGRKEKELDNEPLTWDGLVADLNEIKESFELLPAAIKDLVSAIKSKGAEAKDGIVGVLVKATSDIADL